MGEEDEEEEAVEELVEDVSASRGKIFFKTPFCLIFVITGSSSATALFRKAAVF